MIVYYTGSKDFLLYGRTEIVFYISYSLLPGVPAILYSVTLKISLEISAYS